MNRWTMFSKQSNLSRKVIHSLMVPAVIGAILWKFYEVAFVSLRGEGKPSSAIVNGIILFSAMAYMVVQFVIETDSSRKPQPYTHIGLVLDVVLLSLFSWLVLSLPIDNSYVITSYLAAGIFFILLVWNMYFLKMIAKASLRDRRAMVFPVLNLLGIAVALVCAHFRNIIAGATLAFSSLTLLNLWLFLPSLGDTKPRK